MKRVFLLFLLGLLFLPSPAFAGNPVELPFQKDTKNIQHLPYLVPEKSEAIQAKTSVGILGARRIVATIGSYLALTLGAVAVFMLFLAGYQLVTAQSAASEEMEKQKMNVIYILLGLIVFMLGGEFVYEYLYAAEGQYLLNVNEALGLATKSVARLKEVINLFLSFSGAGAILMLVVSGIRLLLGAKSDEEIDKEKKVVAYVIVGIIIIGLSDTLINQIVFPGAGYSPMNVRAFEVQLQGLSNYILGFLGAVIFITIILGGVMIVVNNNDEETWNKVKTSLKNVVIGSLLVFSAYTIVATVLRTLLAARTGVSEFNGL